MVGQQPGKNVDKTQLDKGGVLRDVNAGIREAAEHFDQHSDQPEEWEFFCECGAADCHALLLLTVRAYVAKRETDEPLLAPGHTLSPAERVRRQAQHQRDDARALRAQAEHQTKRARKNQADADQNNRLRP